MTRFTDVGTIVSGKKSTGATQIIRKLKRRKRLRMPKRANRPGSWLVFLRVQTPQTPTPPLFKIFLSARKRAQVSHNIANNLIPDGDLVQLLLLQIKEDLDLMIMGYAQSARKSPRCIHPGKPKRNSRKNKMLRNL